MPHGICGVSLDRFVRRLGYLKGKAGTIHVMCVYNYGYALDMGAVSMGYGSLCATVMQRTQPLQSKGMENVAIEVAPKVLSSTEHFLLNWQALTQDMCLLLVLLS